MKKSLMLAASMLLLSLNFASGADEKTQVSFSGSSTLAPVMLKFQPTLSKSTRLGIK